MHAAAWRRGYPTDSSDLVAGAAGSATPAPSPHLRLPDRGQRLMLVPVGRMIYPDLEGHYLLQPVVLEFKQALVRGTFNNALNQRQGQWQVTQ